MFCKYCGNEIQDGSKFCNHCGRDLTVEEVHAEVYEPNKKSDEINVLALVGFILSLCGMTVVSLVLSIIGKVQIKKDGGKGDGFATAGIIISSIEIGALVIVGIVYLIILIMAIAAGTRASTPQTVNLAIF